VSREQSSSTARSRVSIGPPSARCAPPPISSGRRTRRARRTSARAARARSPRPWPGAPCPRSGSSRARPGARRPLWCACSGSPSSVLPAARPARSLSAWPSLRLQVVAILAELPGWGSHFVALSAPRAGAGSPDLRRHPAAYPGRDPGERLLGTRGGLNPPAAERLQGIRRAAMQAGEGLGGLPDDRLRSAAQPCQRVEDPPVMPRLVLRVPGEQGSQRGRVRARGGAGIFLPRLPLIFETKASSTVLSSQDQPAICTPSFSSPVGTCGNASGTPCSSRIAAERSRTWRA
jgi:hypothetical protein